MTHRNCDHRCLNAKSRLCSCKCGGANHGAGYDPTADPQRPTPAIPGQTQTRREPDLNPEQLILI
jgi:hypothetical protein